jgi:hypothetical protein
MADMTPAAWLEALERALDERWARQMRLPDDYYNGEHRLAFATSKFREAFGNLFAPFADNWCPLIVSSSAERLNVQGFRFGGQATADKDAWSIWQENGLDAESGMAHTEAIKLGEAYWLLQPPAEPGGMPQITAEHPQQMIVATAPANRRQRLAALKKWIGEDEHAYATLYLPDVVHKFRSQEKARAYHPNQWVRRPGDPGQANPLGEVPVVPLRNDPSMLAGGRSDLQPAIPIVDAINKMAIDMIVASEYAAYRQRVMTGVEQPKDASGKPLPIELGVTRLFTVEAADAKVYDLNASDLGNYVGAIEMFVSHLAAQTRTPPHYLIGKIVNASGDALKAAEAGLTSKCRDKMVTFGEGHEEIMRLALKSQGRDVAGDAETIWADPESRSFGELVDGLTKLATIGVPHKALWEKAGFSPQEIDRFTSMQSLDDLLREASTPSGAQSNGGVIPAANGNNAGV